MENTKKLQKREEKNTKYYCELCDYTSYNKCNYEKHLITIKHEKMQKGAKGISNKIHKIYICEACNYNTRDKTKYDVHMNTNKHIINANRRNTGSQDISDNTPNIHTSYIHSSENNIMIDKNIFYSLMKDNHDFKSMMLEQNKQIIELSSKKNSIVTTNANNTTTNNNTINNNQKFNLNFFLNEQCKDAMNLSDFVDSIDVSIQDLEYVGEHGYVNGITKIIMDNLNQLDLYKRPIHCTDIKREVIHIKDNDKWEKDTNDNEKMKKFIASIGRKNSDLVFPWQLQNPEYQILDSPKYNQWLMLAMRSNEYSKEQKNHEAILRNVAKRIYLDKNEINTNNII
jgi:hypothetical protein